MSKEHELHSDNQRIRAHAQQDSLTGLLNSWTLEWEINEALTAKVPGVFLIIDVDDFHYINDEYSHLTGDRLLRSLARILEHFFFKKDIIGRLDADEFAVFLPGCYTEEMLEKKLQELDSRTVSAGKELGIRDRLRFSSGASFAIAGDSYQSLYDHTEAAVQAAKKDPDQLLHFYNAAMQSGASPEGTSLEGISPEESAPEAREEIHDMFYICRQLEEAEPSAGTYCQDYDAFLSIFRFLERGLDRSGLKVHLILLTLTDENGAFVALKEREQLMEQLKESLQSSLRFSDIFTHYSSCQYLIMTPGAGQEDMDIIVSRITRSFQSSVSGRPDVYLSFGFYPLQQISWKKTSSSGNA